MDPVVRTYDSKAIAMSFNNPVQDVIISGTGLPDGDFLSITTPDSFVGEDGADGTHDRANLNNNTLTVEITLKKSSLTNTLLSTVHQADKLTNLGKGALNIVDTNGTMFLISSQAYITKFAEVTLGKGISAVTWTFMAPNAKYNVGNNL